jgi:hypothetical protein
MLSGKITSLMTSQDSPVFVWHHVNHTHDAGSGAVTVPVKLPRTKSHDGFPRAYTVSVTPSQPCVVSVTDKTSSGFNVVLTPLSGTIAKGSIDVMVLG